MEQQGQGQHHMKRQAEISEIIQTDEGFGIYFRPNNTKFQTFIIVFGRENNKPLIYSLFPNHNHAGRV